MLTKFIGRQIARVKFARDYFNIISSIVSMISLVIIALDVTGIKLSIFDYLVLLILTLVIFWFLGLITDKLNIISADQRQYMRANLEGTGMIWEEVIIPQIKQMMKEINDEKRTS